METSESLEARRAQHLVETEWLAQRIAEGDDRLRIIDMRGYVRTQNFPDGTQTASYEGAPDDYSRAHIPGAIYLDWTRDIVDEHDPVPAQVAPAEKLARLLGQAGIGDEHLIVAYDAHPAAQFATRLWWVMRYYGHDNARVLNGGWLKWTTEDRPVTTNLPRYPPAIFTPRLQPEWRATAEQVRELLGHNDVTLFDARDMEQYTGRIRRGKRGGHIPGAKHLPREALFTPDGMFRPAQELLQIVSANGADSDKRTIAYCNGGVAATTVLFALSMLGYDQLTNYDGSWNEWSEREELPIE